MLVVFLGLTWPTLAILLPRKRVARPPASSGFLTPNNGKEISSSTCRLLPGVSDFLSRNRNSSRLPGSLGFSNSSKATSIEETDKFMSNEVMVEQPEFTGTVNPFVRTRVIRYGLPCANCKIYYSADLTACPICHCEERVSPTLPRPHSVVRH